MNLSTIEGWDTTHTTTDDATFSLMMSPDESTGIFRQATPLTLMSQEINLSFGAFPPLRQLHEEKKGN